MWRRRYIRSMVTCHAFYPCCTHVLRYQLITRPCHGHSLISAGRLRTSPCTLFPCCPVTGARVTKVVFSCRKSVSRDVRTEYNLDLRFLVKFNDNGGFVVGTHKHFSWEYKKSLFFMVYKRYLLADYAKN